MHSQGEHACIFIISLFLLKGPNVDIPTLALSAEVYCSTQLNYLQNIQ